MSTSEFYLAAAESTNPNDTWWFLGFLPILLLVAFWIAALISIIFFWVHACGEGALYRRYLHTALLRTADLVPLCSRKRRQE